MSDDPVDKPEPPKYNVLYGLGFVIVLACFLPWTIRQGKHQAEHSKHGHSANRVWEQYDAQLDHDAHHQAQAAAKVVEDKPTNLVKDDSVQPARVLREFYHLRAYAGAPPRIPHDVSGDMSKENDCLTCHAQGGFVPKYQAFAPVTPHPQYESCRQCHVPDDPKGKNFSPMDWASAAPPKVGNQAMGGAPPRIPHTLQLRTNCVACHSGPGSVAEIRSGHPEREHCLQCHVPSEGSAPWQRGKAITPDAKVKTTVSQTTPTP